MVEKTARMRSDNIDMWIGTQSERKKKKELSKCTYSPTFVSNYLKTTEIH